MESQNLPMEDFSLNDSGELYIRWNLNTTYAKLQLNELIGALIQEYRHTGGVYDAFIENDGKLVGNEKIVIIRNLRDVIQLSVCLKNQLSTKYIKKSTQEEKIICKFIDEYSFQLTYKYTNSEIEDISSVKIWYDNYFKKEILKFTDDFKKALDDKVISEEEAIELVKILDHIILGAAILFNKLTFENLTN